MSLADMHESLLPMNGQSFLLPLLKFILTVWAAVLAHGWTGDVFHGVVEAGLQFATMQCMDVNEIRVDE